MSERAARLSLTRTQLAESACVELLAILQTITADGRLSAAEVTDLREWLTQRHDLAIPATTYLRQVVEHVLSDGIVTADEARLVYKAVESVLPRDVRLLSQFARRTADKTEREQKRSEKERERADRERERPFRRKDFMVAGVRYEGRWRVVEECVSEGDRVWLVRDPSNPHSRHAIEVQLADGQQIGYVPEVLAKTMAADLDAGSRQEFQVKKILTYGRATPVIVGALYAVTATSGAHPPAGATAGVVAVPVVRAEASTAAGLTSAVPMSSPPPTQNARPLSRLLLRSFLVLVGIPTAVLLFVVGLAWLLGVW